MLKNLIENTASPWTMGDGTDSDVVLCTRIRLARNFAQYPQSGTGGWHTCLKI